jgi:hypothetical protein
MQNFPTGVNVICRKLRQITGGLNNSGYPAYAESNYCFIIYSVTVTNKTNKN